jgi:hypothetical protein
MERASALIHIFCLDTQGNFCEGQTHLGTHHGVAVIPESWLTEVTARKKIISLPADIGTQWPGTDDQRS